MSKQKKVPSVDISSLQLLRSFAHDFSKNLHPCQLILLEGPMASGKTTFVNELCQALGGRVATSPTFAIHQEYSLKNGMVLDHLDLYRLKNDQDLESTGFWDLFERKKGLIIVEWADRLQGKWWPSSWSCVRLRFEATPQHRRIYILD